jgi:nicotinate-nucleotide adenylyltransferase
MFEAPLLEISASYIRQQLKEGKSIRYLVPDAAREGIEEGNVYRNLKPVK